MTSTWASPTSSAAPTTTPTPPKQMLILQALGEEPPLYAHVPLLHGPDGKKLSKRHGAASVQELRERGYLPEAVRNYVALLGWGNEESQEFFTTEQLISASSRSSGSRSRRRCSTSRSCATSTAATCASSGSTTSPRGSRRSPGARGCATRPRSRRRRSRRSRISGRWQDSSSTGRPTIRRRARRSWARRRRSSGSRRRATALAAVEAPWTEEALETALQSVLEAHRGEAAAGLPADPRRARRGHRLARDLRDAEAARARRVAAPDRRGPQPYVHRCRYRLKAGSCPLPTPLT